MKQNMNKHETQYYIILFLLGLFGKTVIELLKKVALRREKGNSS